MLFHVMGLNNFWLFFLEFCLSAAVVLFAGHKLAFYGDRIAAGSKFSHGWIGFILMAFITSLPELMTGISATAFVGSVDLVIGDTIGSNAVNIVILAAMFFFARKAMLKLKIEEMITGFAGLFLATMIGAFILIKTFAGISNLGSILLSVSIALVYFFIVYVSFRTGGLKEEGEEIEENKEKNIGVKFTLFSLLIIFSSIWMTKTADFIAETPMIFSGVEYVLGQTFVGGLLLAIATSLPEMAVTFSAAKMGNISMAVGNIFGSNIFNVFIIPISAIFYRGNFWGDVSFSNLFLVFLVFAVTAVMGVDLIAKVKLQNSKLSVLNVLTLLIWIVGMVVIFMANNAALIP